jgi:hypothetical protein
MKFAYITLAVVGAAAVTSAATTGNKFVKFTHDERGTPMAHVTVDASKMFPGAAADLSGFSLDVGYTNYNVTLFDKLAHDLENAHSTPAIKVAAVVSALYGQEYRTGFSAEHDEDHHRLSVMANPSAHGSLAERQSYVAWASGHAINLVTCAGFLSCISGTTCNFYVTINQAPRSRCENQGGQNCCLSWANYDVKAGFFKATWTTCYNSRPSDTDSCEGYDNGGGNNGDVCYSNRSTGCT